VLSLLVVGAALALAACPGSGSTASNAPPATPGGSVSASPTSTSSAAATPVRLVGSDLVAVTQKVVDAQRAALQPPTAGKLIRPYAHDVVFNAYASGMHNKGRAAGLRAFRKNVAGCTGVRWPAGYAGRGWAAVIWTAATKPLTVSTPIGVTMLEIRDGKIARETLYYTSTNVPFGT